MKRPGVSQVLAGIMGSCAFLLFWIGTGTLSESQVESGFLGTLGSSLDKALYFGGGAFVAFAAFHLWSRTKKMDRTELAIWVFCTIVLLCSLVLHFA